MFNERPQVGQEVLNVPFGEMIKSMAFAIAEAQLMLDENSIEVAEMMGGLKAVTYEIKGEEHLNFEDSRVFFGKQKMTVSNAIDTHNTITDQAQRQSIRNELDGRTSSFDTEDPKDIVLRLAVSESGEDFVYIPQKVSMMEIGFTPTFYQFVDSMIDVTIAINFTEGGEKSNSITTNSESKSGGLSFGFRRGLRSNRSVNTTQVNASYTQKYSYSSEASSSLRTKLVPIPAPAILEERIRLQMELSREEDATT